MNFERVVPICYISALALTFSSATLAQEPQEAEAGAEEAPTNAMPRIEDVLVVVGIRTSLQTALMQKRNAANLVEIINAEDIGKLPDQNLAEVLENLPGLQITRTAGVGTGVQIRGTNANRTEINGVSTVGSGAGRTGIDFEDVSAAIIASTEVTKSPQAKTIEGSVGGTINLKTIRPLGLSETLAAVRVQGENSSLSTDSTFAPRYSAAFGDNWRTEAGEFGFVVSGSYTQQDVSAFRPRADRDNDKVVDANRNNPGTTEFDFLPIQFFVQDYDNYEYDTANLATTFEWAPNEGVKFYVDAIINDQESRQESSRVQTSGVSNVSLLANVTEFQTVDFGTLQGENGPQNLGSIPAAVRGVIPAFNESPWDPNLRLSSDTNSRLTDSTAFRFGTEWSIGRLRGQVEVARTRSESTTPSINTTLNFINPKRATGTPNENGTPIVFDLTGGSLTFGIAHDDPYAPNTADLLTPANYRLRDVNISRDLVENGETAVRGDFAYDLNRSAITGVDFGYRYSESSSLSDDIGSNKGLRNMVDAPSGDTFASVLTRGPDNFNEADGRALYVPDFLLIDPEQVASNPDGVFAILSDAVDAHHATTGSTRGGLSMATSRTSAFFDIEEATSALYVQANFEQGIFRGDVGFRYVDTRVTSTGNTVTNNVATPTTTEGSYNFLLPRFNVVASVHEDVQLRAGWSKDLRRPNFDDLSTSFSFSTSPNPAVAIGNPSLQPEEVESFDLTAEWYFAPASVVSIGYFYKGRTGLFVRDEEDPIEDDQGFRDITDPCEGGGIFNPIADPNVFAPPGTDPGVCVPSRTTINGAGKTTQQGVELSFQFDLSEFEDTLGWASGFGFIGNYTSQDFSGGDEYLRAFSRPTDIFNALGAQSVVTLRQPLIDLSDSAYNATAYYEKYRISARLRYTWREAYRSTDFGSTSSFPWGFPVVQEDRGQLNAAVTYRVNDRFGIEVQGVNLTEEDVVQSCVNSGALLCYQGLTDRRVTIGASYRM